MTASPDVPTPEGDEPADVLVPLHEQEWPRPWMGKFLESLAALPNQAAAARLVRISRETARWWRRRDERFNAAVAQALEAGLDLVEQEIHRRGVTGFDKVVTRTHIERDSTGAVVKEVTVTTTIHEVSDSLLIQYARAHRPERWRERVDHRHGGDPGAPIRHEHEVIDEAVRQFDAEVVRLHAVGEAEPLALPAGD